MPPGYAGVIRRLQAQGVAVRAPMNPLRGLASDADAIARYTTTIEGPIVLVGHSYGGAVISQALPAVNDVRALVFLRVRTRRRRELRRRHGTVPTVTARIDKHRQRLRRAGSRWRTRPVHRHRPIPRDLLRRPPRRTSPGRWRSDKRPLSAAAFTEPATVVGWRDLPTWYLVSEHDTPSHPTANA
jgi:pimeloyl-ACP methyl ester carboxylesterase